LSTRTIAKQNLLVASVNAALERHLLTLECEPVASAVFEFNIGPYPVIAALDDAGFDEVAIKAIVCPTELGRRMVQCAIFHGCGSGSVRRRRSLGCNGEPASICNQV
jgi:hypothetical protein